MPPDKSKRTPPLASFQLTWLTFVPRTAAGEHLLQVACFGCHHLQQTGIVTVAATTGPPSAGLARPRTAPEGLSSSTSPPEKAGNGKPSNEAGAQSAKRNKEVTSPSSFYHIQDFLSRPLIEW
ncbi:MAG: hypothetical protein IMW94_04370 [Thermoanaerobacter sp.]|nr:hypothetical protein [Thermoanaerobacter sp.]